MKVKIYDYAGVLGNPGVIAELNEKVPHWVSMAKDRANGVEDVCADWSDILDSVKGRVTMVCSYYALDEDDCATVVLVKTPHRAANMEMEVNL